MGRRGPIAAPTRVKIKQGETRPSRVNFNEPQPQQRAPKMPRDLSAGAKAVWKRVLDDMRDTDVIVSADADVLRVYCEAVDRYVKAQAIYQQSGVLLNRGGILVKNPVHQVVRDNAEQIRLLARELGLSPASRSALHIAAASAANGPQSIDADLGPPPRLRVVGGTYE